MKPKQTTWARYRGQYYVILDANREQALIQHPNATGPYDVNVGSATMPIMVLGMGWVNRSLLDIMRESPIAPLPPIPMQGGLQVGARCRWGSSLAEWSIIAIADEVAKIRQVSGWAEAIEFDAPVSELLLLRSESEGLRAA